MLCNLQNILLNKKAKSWAFSPDKNLRCNRYDSCISSPVLEVARKNSNLSFTSSRPSYGVIAQSASVLESLRMMYVCTSVNICF